MGSLPRRWRWPLVALGAVGLGLAAAAAWLLVRRHAGREVLARFDRSSCVSPKLVEKTRTWDRMVALPGGIRVHITGREWVSGHLDVAYPGESPRTVAPAVDYVYPSDVRIDRRTNTLLVAASGSAGGVWRTAGIYVFDLDRRRVVTEVAIDPDTLPPECPPVR